MSEVLLMSGSYARLVGAEYPDARLADCPLHSPTPYYVVRHYRNHYNSTAHPWCPRPPDSPGEACGGAETTIKPQRERAGEERKSFPFTRGGISVFSM